MPRYMKYHYVQVCSCFTALQYTHKQNHYYCRRAYQMYYYATLLYYFSFVCKFAHLH